MKKKVISLLLALCVLCGCLPITASAAESGEPSSYTVSFDPNGGTVPQTQKAVQQHTPYGALPAPIGGERQQFTGWYTAPSGGDRVYPYDEFTAGADQTLYAHWETYTSSLTPTTRKKPTILIPMNKPAAYWLSFGCSVVSYVYPNDIGGLTWVMAEESLESCVVVEEYDRNLALRARKEIKSDMVGRFLCGGFLQLPDFWNLQ